MRLPDDQSRILRWNAVLWVLFGLGPELVAAHDVPAGLRNWALGVPAMLGAAYAVSLRLPGRRVPWFLWVLAAGIGAVSYLQYGAASLYIVSFPLFWLTARTVLQSIGLSGLAAGAALVGAILRGGEPVSGNAVVTLFAYGVGTILALTIRRWLERAEQRAERLGEQLADARSELAEAHRRQGAAEERERMAREIHDTLAQGLASIVVLAEAARSDVHADTASRLLSIERIARENLAEARVLVGSSPKEMIAPGSIARTLRRTVDRFAEDTGLTVHAELADLDCDQPTRIALLRCTQESLANIRKHAAASTVGVVLEGHPQRVELEVTDDGRGFAVEDSSGFGLAGMRRRLEDLGGELTVTSSIGDGTRVLAVLPVEDRP
ncbi:hypothetical protein GCM10023195_69310 [Actinoallomurus liliacearum]|uniref:Oxygen sensor histidine kinase NreB n=1 Tax=Actinoallomurus liliacearum TaxID=1080073 RepID=A0ABP8TWN6_9ACTN